MKAAIDLTLRTFACIMIVVDILINGPAALSVIEFVLTAVLLCMGIMDTPNTTKDEETTQLSDLTQL